MKTHLKNKHRALILKALGPESPYGIEPQFVKSDGALMRLTADVLADLRERVSELADDVQVACADAAHEREAVVLLRTQHSNTTDNFLRVIKERERAAAERDDLRATDAQLRPALIELARALGLDPDTTCQIEMLKRARDAIAPKAPAPQQWPPPVGTRVRWRYDGDEGTVTQVNGDRWHVFYDSGQHSWRCGDSSAQVEILS